MSSILEDNFKIDLFKSEVAQGLDIIQVAKIIMVLSDAIKRTDAEDVVDCVTTKNANTL